ncbi:MAG: ATP-binding protein [Sphingomonas sp.]|jgi:signal transduction histidine kinase
MLGIASRASFIFVIVALIFCNSVIFSKTASAQQVNDSHSMLFNQRIATMIESAKAKMLIDPHQTIDDAEEIEQIALSEKNIRNRKLIVATALWLQGEAYIRLGDLQQSKIFVDSAYEIVSSLRIESKLTADILLSRGSLFAIDPNVSAALSDYQKAYKIYRSINDSRGQAVSLVYLATLYTNANDNNSALKYYSEALDLSSIDKKLSISIYNNRGISNLNNNNYKMAIDDFKKAISFSREIGSKSLEAQILLNLMDCQIRLGQLSAAEKEIARGLSISSSQGMGEERRLFIGASARIAFVRGQFQKAADLIQRRFVGVDLATTSLSFRDSHETAFEVYKRLGNSGLALQHLEAMKRLDDETAKLAASTNTALMAARFDYANQNLKIATLKQRGLQRTVAFEKARARAQQAVFAGVVLTILVGVSMLIVGLLTIRRSRNEVRAANFDLAETNAALERALAAKTEFLATTSHEIRTPLNGILGMTQVMLADRSLEQPIRERLGVVHNAGVTMRALVDDILDMAKMESGNLTLEQVTVDLHRKLTEVSRLWKEQAESRGVEFHLDLTDCPPVVRGDPSRMRQIIFNLLSNAMKFTKQGSVTVRAGVAYGAASDGASDGAGRGEMLQISVIDTGIGIPKEKQEEIFESFRQADAGTTRKFGGTGLGLAICRNLARAMGGDVTVSSEPGEGAAFILSLPLELANLPEIADETEAARQDLMIVDRNPIARSMLRALFAPCAADIGCADSYEGALAMLGAGPVERILVDENTLPAADGVANGLKRILAAANGAPVHVVTAALSPSQRAQLLALGVAQIIEKPVGGMELVKLVYGDAGDFAGKAAINALEHYAA